MRCQRLGKVEGGKDLYVMYIFAYVCKPLRKAVVPKIWDFSKPSSCFSLIFSVLYIFVFSPSPEQANGQRAALPEHYIYKKISIKDTIAAISLRYIPAYQTVEPSLGISPCIVSMSLPQRPRHLAR